MNIAASFVTFLEDSFTKMQEKREIKPPNIGRDRVGFVAFLEDSFKRKLQQKEEIVHLDFKILGISSSICANFHRHSTQKLIFEIKKLDSQEIKTPDILSVKLEAAKTLEISAKVFSMSNSPAKFLVSELLVSIDQVPDYQENKIYQIKITSDDEERIRITIEPQSSSKCNPLD